MKKGFALLLAIIITCTSVAFAFADEEQKNLLDSIGSFFSNAWNDVSDWTDTALKDASAWVATAWGDASEWISQAWDDSSSWVTDIWGDASAWATESYISASETVLTWWADTFYNVTDTSQFVWTWLKESASSQSIEQKAVLEQIKNVIALNDETAESAVKDLFGELLEKIGITEKDAERVWKSVYAFAEEKGISKLTAAKLSLPYLFQLAVDEQAETNRSIPAIAVAQYLTGIIEKLGVQSDAVADKLVVSLLDVLDEI